VAGAATCDFNAGTVSVSVDGSVVLAVGASGEIEHDGSPCGAATVTNTDLIQVTGQADATRAPTS